MVIWYRKKKKKIHEHTEPHHWRQSYQSDSNWIFRSFLVWGSSWQVYHRTESYSITCLMWEPGNSSPRTLSLRAVLSILLCESSYSFNWDDSEYSDLFEGTFEQTFEQTSEQGWRWSGRYSKEIKKWDEALLIISIITSLLNN